MLLAEQYECVRDSRGALLSYCHTISSPHLSKSADAFAGRSMLYLLGHVISAYQYWLEELVTGRKPMVLDDKGVSSLDEVRSAFGHVDHVVKSFLDKFHNKLTMQLTMDTRVNGPINVTPLKLLTHVMTHEFHHKGQILAISRQLGYTPVDTDVIRLP